MTLRSVSILVSLVAFALAARGDVALAPLFTSGAVLQRDKLVPIWGTAEADEKVTVTFAGQTARATAGRDGRWIVTLEALAANATGAELVVTGKNTVTLSDVVVGEVWLCSGQSNMEWPVRHANDPEREIAAANFPLLRHVKIQRTVAERPADSVATRDGWQSATPETVGAFSAVGYFFARDLHQKLGLPIGLVNSTWGGTPIESWMSPAALASDPAFAVVAERWKEKLAAYPELKVTFDQALARWQQDEASAKVQGAEAHAAFLKQHPRPRAPRGPGDSWTPSGLFNGMINPLLPYAIRGVIWYQGESNAFRAHEYHALFSTMINSWRAHFGQGDFPFYWVQLANYEVKENWALLREAQTQTLALANTGQVVAIDIGNPKDIHPRNKQEVGRRLALLARTNVYDIPGDASGPTFASVAREGSSLRVRFAHATGGLVAHNKPVQSLEVAGADRVFHPAVGRVERDTLVVSSPQVKEPVAVRYAWSNSPEANLYNGAGLPAVPFRSDDW